MPKVNGMNHVTFATSNLEDAIEFYVNILGFTLIAHWHTGAYLLINNLWLCLSFDRKTKTQPMPEYTHFALSVDAKEFESLKKIIVAKQIPLWKDNKSEGASLYILDPDYNKLEIHASNLKNRLQYMLENPYPGMKLNKEALNGV